MKANELRINNLIYCNGEIISLDWVALFGVQARRIDGAIINAKFSTPDLKPIPLTEEWLLRLGFEKKEWYGMLVSGGKDISGCDYYKDSTSVRVSLSDDVCQKGVHWFQNWYYFETGEELTIKL